MPKRRTLILGLTSLMVLVLGCGSVAFYRAVTGSLPKLDGEIRMAGLSGPVTIERDRYGVPTVRGGSREDVARATGFVHGQDRFFQMDLLRRSTAGELAALFGAAAADFDRQRRLHRLRVLAGAVVERATPGERTLLEAYADGVNAGLSALPVAPFEYLILRAGPEPWRPEDVVLGNLAMFFELTDHDASRESGYARLLDGIPEPLGRFIFAPGNRWDAPLAGDAWEVPPVPGPDVCDLRGTTPLEAGIEPQPSGPTGSPVASIGLGPQPGVQSDLPEAGIRLGPRPDFRLGPRPDFRLGFAVADARLSRHSDPQLDLPVAGSNSWAVAGQRTSTGRAMVANDMHLGLNLPNVWYRVRLIVTGAGSDGPADDGEGPQEEAEASVDGADTLPEEPSTPPEESGVSLDESSASQDELDASLDRSGAVPELDAAGVTLPGTPLVVAGSNGSIAWGFTNSRGDWSDLVLIETDPANPDTYLTPDGYVPFDEYEEIIEIKGGEPEAVTFRWTRWGPVVGTDHRGRLQALRWLAHMPEAVDLGLSELETAASVTEALALAPRVGIPPQNFVVADARGAIAWTIMGRIPRRAGYDSSLPASWADGNAGWRGWLAPDEYPRVVDPESGLIWTANNRIVDGEILSHMGAAGYWLGARARQIRDALAAVERPRIEDMLAIQLDDRALLLQEWRDVVLEALATGAAAPHPWADEVAEFLQRWDGRAGIDSVSYRIVREFRRRVVEEVLRGVLNGCGDFDGPVPLAATNQVEGPVWKLIAEQPDHLLPTPHASWNGLLTGAVDSAVSTCGAGPLSGCTWGNVNRADIRHPLAGALGLLRPWLAIRGDPLPGGDHMPRIQQPDYGASERFAVAPGDEANGYFHMPGGQSGHPLSPFFSAGHEAWARGEPQPFLPGPALHRLTLSPE